MPLIELDLRASDFLSIYTQDSLLRTLAEGIRTPEHNSIQVKGLSGSLSSTIIASVYKILGGNHVIVLHDKEEASYFINDLQNLLGEKSILFFPMSYKKPYEYDEVENANVLMRAEVLSRWNDNPKHQIIVTYPEALSEKVLNKKSLASNTFIINQGDRLDLPFLAEFLSSFGFEKSDFVYEAGQYSIRGGIVDVFSYAFELPFRIELFGDEVDSLRTFNPGSQLSVEQLNKISLMPNIQTKVILEKRQSLFEFIPDDSRIWIRDVELTTDVLHKSLQKAIGGFDKIASKSGSKNLALEPDELFVNASLFTDQLSEFVHVEFGNRFTNKQTKVFSFLSNPQPSFHKNFEMIVENLTAHQHQNFSCFVASDQPRQLDRLQEIITEINPDLKVQPLPFALHEGFLDHQLKILCYTDHQLFERFHRYRVKERFSKSKAITLRELQALQPGDFVTHIDYGIAKFAGLEKSETSGREQEAIRLVFRDNDLMYVSIHSLHKISKYSGKEGTAPVISKLGSGEWENKKNKVKRKVQDIAKELIDLYAKRKAAPGFAYAPDGFLQAELESSFIYEDTPDQAKATEDVKRDLELAHPMDRLICGDVGFGKTEVAIRAAFKVVSEGKQVAVLVPTTILAMQHERTFSDRLSSFPVKIDYISRFKKSKQIKDMLGGVKSGEINILIGTHRIVSKDIVFKDLGLLVIDEEQKFGVKVKERLKELKLNVDVLTLTATPIPRTLHFSLMGARDLSIISTPPPNRQPVSTTLHTFNEELIRDAVSNELARNGQVFFVHNRVSDIEQVANIIYKLVPDARIGIAHGQMEGDKLERVMLKFIDGEYDVLVSTNIIESGLDIPNANTIIINQAHLIGLSDLHQMRGRVGRSNKKAFCYLLTPQGKLLSADSRKRLTSLEEFSELGDGFKVAMRDLDIRGAGNLLGAEQSGFITDLGFETYHKILDDAILELKETEFKDLFAAELAEKVKLVVQDCIIETDLEIIIPDTYVSNISERLSLYSRIDSLKDEKEFIQFKDQLADRFGPLPPSVEQLINSVKLRWVGEELGFEKITLKNEKLKAQFVSKDEYFKSELFGKILAFVQTHSRSCRMKDVKGKLILTIENILTIDDAIGVFDQVGYKFKSFSETISA